MTSTPSSPRQGFRLKWKSLFDFQGLILGSVEANYFTTAQQDLIQQFVDRRGGGLLFLGGRTALADGGYQKPPFADLLPVHLPDRKNTFHRDPATPELTPAGRDSLITRIEDNPEANVERWKKLPYLMDFQEAGEPKPGALVLAEMKANGNKLPLLITQKYGRGRTAVFATGGDWRWQMLQPVQDMSHEIFWRQMMRWLVSDTPTRVVTTTTRPVLYDDGRVHLRAEVRDTTYLPTSDALVQARIVGPDGSAQSVDLHPDSLEQGVYSADWDAGKAGSYVAEITAARNQQELGRDVITFRREDGVAENFHVEQNRDLLEKLSRKPAEGIIVRMKSAGWARTFPIPTPGSRFARRRICGTCRSCFSWRCCCAAPSGCCVEGGAWYEEAFASVDRHVEQCLAERRDVLRHRRRSRRRARLRATLRFSGAGDRQATARREFGR